jgi:hypothetical protein
VSNGLRYNAPNGKSVQTIEWPANKVNESISRDFANSDHILPLQRQQHRKCQIFMPSLSLGVRFQLEALPHLYGYYHWSYRMRALSLSNAID